MYTPMTMCDAFGTHLKLDYANYVRFSSFIFFLETV